MLKINVPEYLHVLFNTYTDVDSVYVDGFGITRDILKKLPKLIPINDQLKYGIPNNWFEEIQDDVKLTPDEELIRLLDIIKNEKLVIFKEYNYFIGIFKVNGQLGYCVKNKYFYKFKDEQSLVAFIQDMINNNDYELIFSTTDDSLIEGFIIELSKYVMYNEYSTIAEGDELFCKLTSDYSEHSPIDTFNYNPNIRCLKIQSKVKLDFEAVEEFLNEDVRLKEMLDVPDETVCDADDVSAKSNMINRELNLPKEYYSKQNIPWTGIYVHHNLSKKSILNGLSVPSNMSFVKIRVFNEKDNIKIKDFQYSAAGLISAIHYHDEMYLNRIKDSKSTLRSKIKSRNALILSTDSFNYISAFGAEEFLKIVNPLPNFDYKGVAEEIVNRFFNVKVNLKMTYNYKKSNIIQGCIWDGVNSKLNNEYLKLYIKQTWNVFKDNPIKFDYTFCRNEVDANFSNVVNVKEIINTYLLNVNNYPIMYNADSRVIENVCNQIESTTNEIQSIINNENSKKGSEK